MTPRLRSSDRLLCYPPVQTGHVGGLSPLLDVWEPSWQGLRTESRGHRKAHGGGPGLGARLSETRRPALPAERLHVASPRGLAPRPRGGLGPLSLGVTELQAQILPARTYPWSSHRGRLLGPIHPAVPGPPGIKRTRRRRPPLGGQGGRRAAMMGMSL